VEKMSYGRIPYYIYPYENGIRFEGLDTNIPNDAIDQLLYVLLKDNLRNELKERVKNGRKKYLEGLQNYDLADIEFEKSLEKTLIKPLLEDN
jgi:hypothetical protein